MTDEQAEYLVSRYADLILRIGRTWLGNRDDAKDICQTVLIKLLENPMEFPDQRQERAWIVRVAVNECKNWRKTAWFRRTVPLDEGLQLAAAPEPEEDGLLAQVDALPAKYREVIFLRYYEGYEVKEIAALLGRSPALVSTHLKRGKEKLKIMLGGTEYEREF